MMLLSMLALATNKFYVSITSIYYLVNRDVQRIATRI